MICCLVSSEFGCPCSYFFALGIQYRQNLIHKRVRNVLGVFHLLPCPLLTDLAHHERHELVFLSKLEHLFFYSYSLKQCCSCYFVFGFFLFITTKVFPCHKITCEVWPWLWNLPSFYITLSLDSFCVIAMHFMVPHAHGFLLVLSSKAYFGDCQMHLLLSELVSLCICRESMIFILLWSPQKLLFLHQKQIPHVPRWTINVIIAVLDYDLFVLITSLWRDIDPIYQTTICITSRMVVKI